MPRAKSDALIKVSNPDKIFWPDEGYTKLDLVKFYQMVFPVLQPYVADRLLTLERCPGGMNGSCFYQKEKPESMPEGTPSKRIESSSSKRKVTNYVVGGLLTTQLALANLGCIPVHITGSRAKTFPKPDWVCFDLDPNNVSFTAVVKAAMLVKEVLDALGLVSYPKTSGSRGIHIFVPIRVGPTSDEVLQFTEDLVARLAAAHPNQLTAEHSIAGRGKRVYLDAFRNGSVQTVVSPYSVRRKPHAPVSTPLAWSEVKPSLDPVKFNLANFHLRLKKKDPWADFFRNRQNLTAAINRLKRI
jgi:bifunctional non-homologous end joining protein LigD